MAKRRGNPNWGKPEPIGPITPTITELTCRRCAVSAIEDPTITPGRKDYRSFYIEDATFARFRAAIYWLSRREDAAGEVPENMSVAVETWEVPRVSRSRSSQQP
jgi:hypothetical protein